jgi:hypothetical protein
MLHKILIAESPTLQYAGIYFTPSNVVCKKERVDIEEEDKSAEFKFVNEVTQIHFSNGRIDSYRRVYPFSRKTYFRHESGRPLLDPLEDRGKAIKAMNRNTKQSGPDEKSSKFKCYWV